MMCLLSLLRLWLCARWGSGVIVRVSLYGLNSPWLCCECPAHPAILKHRGLTTCVRHHDIDIFAAPPPSTSSRSYQIIGPIIHRSATTAQRVVRPPDLWIGYQQHACEKSPGVIVGTERCSLRSRRQQHRYRLPRPRRRGPRNRDRAIYREQEL